MLRRPRLRVATPKINDRITIERRRS